MLDPPVTVYPSEMVIIDYTNWKGERRKRKIRPLGIRFRSNEFHSETQWLLEAVDMDKMEIRTFAMKNIHSWIPEDEAVVREEHKQ